MAAYLERVHALRAAVPDVSVTTDLIAGFPGESDDDFAQTLELVRAAEFDAAFTFVFSPRRGTAAAELPRQVAAEVKRERVERLIALTQELALGSRRRWIGRCAEELGRDTLFLASGDLSHALTHSAPALYDPRGKLLDDEVVRLLGAGDFVGLGRMDPILLEGAAECGLRSFMALGGFLGDDATVEPEILSYEGPFGVGYMVARFGAAEVERPGVEA